MGAACGVLPLCTMREDTPQSPPVPEYAKAEPKPLGYLSHKQQYLIMFAIAGILAAKEVIDPQLSHVGDVVVFACIPISLLVGNYHLREHRRRAIGPSAAADPTKAPPPP